MPTRDEIFGTSFQEITSTPSIKGSTRESIFGQETTPKYSTIDKKTSEPDNEVGTIESILSGIASGIIKIPEGVVSLGASLYDLGADTNTAAKVEKWFDDINPFDEAAEATAAGKITETLVNLGVPGGVAFTKGASLASKVLNSKKLGKYFTLNNPTLAKAGKQAVELNKKGKTAKYAAGALGSGIAEGIFVGDVEGVGTFGDLLGGPTRLDRPTNDNDEYDPGREIINRIKFGTEGALFSGVIGGVGSTIKKLAKRGKDLAKSNSALDRLIDKVASGFRARGKKAQEFFDIERKVTGLRAGDVNRAQEISRNIDKNIDAIFPNLKSVYNQTVGSQRKEALKKVNDLLLSGTPEVSKNGTVTFGPMNEALKKQTADLLKSRGAKTENVENIFKELDNIRNAWGDMFSGLGTKMPKRQLGEFKNNFTQKFKSYLDTTYEVFENKPLVPFMAYKPTRELTEKVMNSFIKYATDAGETMNREEAEYYVKEVIKTAKIPKGLPITAKKAPEIVIQLPKQLINKTVVNDIEELSQQGFTSLSNLKPHVRETMEELLGKINNPISTILGGTERLSMLSRQNQFLQQLKNTSDELINQGKPGLFFRNQGEAIDAFGRENVSIIEFMDPARKYDAGIPNPVSGMYTSKGMAEALTKSQEIISNDTALGYAINNFVLLPKATSQIAKTILSPITHVRNFISAGAFATANGIIPNKEAITTAFKALQVPVKGARTEAGSDLYRKLLELGVVNSNVRLGDLKQLIGNITFLDDVNPNKYVKTILQKLGKARKVSEDFYTAEDDFWKIATWVSEKNRLTKAYKKVGMNVDEMTKRIEEEAADIVRNNIPNYDYVGSFVKGLRKFPVGNFVSFPVEIMRTGTNIVRRALKEINYKEVIDEGLPTEKIVAPLKNIGMQRLLGFGTTVAAVPYGVVEGAKAIYNIADDELEALRRYVPSWSKNSTLIPIKDKETGKFKYVDFSRANAYDTLTRPIQTVINAVAEGRTDEDGIMDDFVKGLFESTKEIASPFFSESIWTESVLDVLARGGKTRSGKTLYTDQTPWGEKVRTIVGHLVESQTPGSVDAFKRIGLALTEKTDEYGTTYELGDEAAGLLGFRAIQVDPLKSIDFKIADFQTGIKNARREFTYPLLKGGPITAGDIVDRYNVANKAMFDVKKELLKDYLAALKLGVKEDDLDKPFRERGERKELSFIKEGVFKPMKVSSGVKKGFEEIAENNKIPNPWYSVEGYIDTLYDFYNEMPLLLESLPDFPNPFKETELSPTDTSYLPTSGQPTVTAQPTTSGLNIQQKGQQVFGPFDRIFGG